MEPTFEHGVEEDSITKPHLFERFLLLRQKKKSLALLLHAKTRLCRLVSLTISERCEIKATAILEGCVDVFLIQFVFVS